VAFFDLNKITYLECDIMLNILPNDIEITIFETPKHNWGIRGLPGDELNLNYKAEI
jgi:hypothetical protein